MKAKQSDDICQSEYACFLFCLDNDGKRDIVALGYGPSSTFNAGLYWYKNTRVTTQTFGGRTVISSTVDYGAYMSLGDVNNGV